MTEGCPLCGQAVGWPKPSVKGRTFFANGKSCALMRKQAIIAELLLVRPRTMEGLVMMLYAVWQPAYPDRSVKSLISQLRRRLEPVGWTVQHIHSHSACDPGQYALVPFQGRPRRKRGAVTRGWAWGRGVYAEDTQTLERLAAEADPEA
jgi:hypothetical protein